MIYIDTKVSDSHMAHFKKKADTSNIPRALNLAPNKRMTLFSPPLTPFHGIIIKDEKQRIINEYTKMKDNIKTGQLKEYLSPLRDHTMNLESKSRVMMPPKEWHPKLDNPTP